MKHLEIQRHNENKNYPITLAWDYGWDALYDIHTFIPYQEIPHPDDPDMEQVLLTFENRKQAVKAIQHLTEGALKDLTHYQDWDDFDDLGTDGMVDAANALDLCSALANYPY